MQKIEVRHSDKAVSSATYTDNSGSNVLRAMDTYVAESREAIVSSYLNFIAQSILSASFSRCSKVMAFLRRRKKTAPGYFLSANSRG